MIYNLSISKLVSDYLNPIFGKIKTIAFLNAFLAPVQQKHSDFITFKTQMDAAVTITIQVNRMRQALRDKFADNTIDIIHPGQYLAQAFIYTFGEPQPAEYDYQFSEAHTPVEYDYLFGEYQVPYDFIVKIPSSLANLTTIIYDFVNQYNFAGIRFAVQTL